MMSTSVCLSVCPWQHGLAVASGLLHHFYHCCLDNQAAFNALWQER